jgi:Ser/Thr protein kinase RdoA (MazF antagonist)
MMKLSTMQAIVATVDDQWESPLADVLLQHWAHDRGRAKYWRASANFIFFFQHSGRDQVLRFNHASERTLEAIQAELAYVNALADHGIRVAKPIRSLAGNEVETIATPQGSFHAVVFEALPGKPAEFDELTPEQFLRWGQALGELHNAAEHYHSPGRPTWEDHLKLAAEILPAEERGARQALEKLQGQLRQIPIRSKNFG